MAQNVYIQGFDQLRRKFDKLGKGLGDVRLMGQVGAFVNLQIKARAAKGVDVSESKFTPYSPQYEKSRRDAGHPTGSVNLFFTGSMFSSLTYEAKSDQVTSFFMNTVDKVGSSNPQKAFFNDQLRPFFGLTDSDVDQIEKMVLKGLSKQLE